MHHQHHQIIIQKRPITHQWLCQQELRITLQRTVPMRIILPHWEMHLRLTMTLVTSKKGLGMSQGKSHTRNMTQSFLTTYQIVTKRASLIKLHNLTATHIELKGLISLTNRKFIAPFHLNHMTKSNRSYMWILMPKMRELHLDLFLSFKLILMSRMTHVAAQLRPLKICLNVKFSAWSKRKQRVMMNMLS